MTAIDIPLDDALLGFLKGNSKYSKAISQFPDSGARVEIDWAELDRCNGVGDYLREKPAYLLYALEKAAYEMLQENLGAETKKMQRRVKIALVNTPTEISMRKIRGDMVAKFIRVLGTVIRMSDVETIPLKLDFECENEHIYSVIANDDLSIFIPKKCTVKGCGANHTIIGGVYEDYQVLDMQERSEDLPSGMLPKIINVFLRGDLVDTARMGDIVEIGGIVKSELSKRIKLSSEIQTFRQRLHANYVIRMIEKNEQIDRMDEINKLAEMSEEELTGVLVDSFSPHIYGSDVIKESILLTIVSAPSTVLDDGTRIRGEINTFLIGDPGTAKSEMGKAAYRVAPKAFYTSGKGASGVGLTAATIRDEITGAFMLEPGIVVLADGGLAVIDEFDKMEQKDRSALHECMEQGHASIARGGINARLNARTSVLAIANPHFGRYDPFKSIIENVPSIPIPLLTRFDLIFVVRDIPSSEKDKKIAEHIIHTIADGLKPTGTNKVDTKLLSLYLKHAKTLKPVITQEAQETIRDHYLKLRLNSEDDIISHRQLGGLMRLTLARARLLLKKKADKSDAERAIYVMKQMLDNSTTDPDSGQTSITEINTGRSGGSVRKERLFMDIINGMKADAFGVHVEELTREMVASGKWERGEAAQYIQRMLQESIIYERATDKYQLVSGGY